jgi:hypothetical protein
MSASFVCCHVHAGPELGIPNLKKSQKCETFAWRHFISPRYGKKNSNLDKSNLPENPFTKMTYQVRGCMALGQMS